MTKLLPIVFLTALAACGDPPTDTNGDEAGARCAVVASSELGADEVSALGFSAADALAIAGGSHSGSLAYADGSSSDLTVSVVSRGSARYLDREWQDDGSGEEIMPVDELATDDSGAEEPGEPGDTGVGDTGGVFVDPCADIVQIDITLEFASADGRFAESFATTLDAPSADGSSAQADLDLGNLSGSYSLDTAQYESFQAWIQASFDASGAHGVVEGQGTGSDGEVAWAETVAIGTF